MTTIRLHSFTTDPGFTPNHGTESADFRGSLFIGSAHGDEHKTLAEQDNVSDEEILIALTELPAINAQLLKMEVSLESALPGSMAGQVPKLRFGIWDKVAPGN